MGFKNTAICLRVLSECGYSLEKAADILISIPEATNANTNSQDAGPAEETIPTRIVPEPKMSPRRESFKFEISQKSSVSGNDSKVDNGQLMAFLGQAPLTNATTMKRRASRSQPADASMNGNNNNILAPVSEQQQPKQQVANNSAQNELVDFFSSSVEKAPAAPSQNNWILDDLSTTSSSSAKSPARSPFGDDFDVSTPSRTSSPVSIVNSSSVQTITPDLLKQQQQPKPAKMDKTNIMALFNSKPGGNNSSSANGSLSNLTTSYSSQPSPGIVDQDTKQSSSLSRKPQSPQLTNQQQSMMQPQQQFQQPKINGSNPSLNSQTIPQLSSSSFGTGSQPTATNSNNSNMELLFQQLALVHQQQLQMQQMMLQQQFAALLQQATTSEQQIMIRQQFEAQMMQLFYQSQFAYTQAVLQVSNNVSPIVSHHNHI